ncbi:MAG: helix-turn-helix domain-containing protein [Oscillospiraceae bacterium]|nr:helix-turn-helix domain-containing protein [Oscillospiraceae bacterium]
MLYGISRQMLCNIELGKNSVSINTLINICNVSGLSADYIVLNKTDDSSYLEKIQNKFSKYSEEELEKAIRIMKDITNC